MIFIGSYCSGSYIRELIDTKSSPDLPGITLQEAILKGLKDNDEDTVVFSIPNRASYPKSSKIFVKEERINISTIQRESRLLGYINLPIIKLFSKFLSMRRSLKSYLNQNRKNNGDVFIYSLHSPMLLAAVSLKKKYRHLCVMVTDLPEYMTGKHNLLYRIGKSLDRIIIDHCLRKADSFVLLSEKMINKLPIKGMPYVVIEGIYGNTDSHIKEYNVDKFNDKEVILYTGGIAERYNVYDLVDAIIKIHNNNLELWLCGPVDDKERLDKYLRKDQRIKYLGILPKDEVRNLQKKVSLLINPRFGREEFTKYSFPSKTLEYLASGTPTMMCELPSLPKEYLDKIYLIDNESIGGIKNSIEKFFMIPKEMRNQKATKAKEFILEEKSSKSQTKRIIEMISKS